MNTLRLDPSRTSGIRRSYMASMKARFRILKAAIIKLVETEDAFGLEPHITRNTRYQFRTDSEKVADFRDWLEEQVSAGFLITKGKGAPWTKEYIDSAHRQGIVRAYTDSAKGSKGKFYDGGKKQFLQDAFAGPESTKKLEQLYTRSFTDLKGMTDAMAAQLSRTLTEGLANGLGARALARELVNNVSGMERSRAMTIARTEVIRAHAEGQLDSFEMLGDDELVIDVEWQVAAGACPKCSGNAGKVYTIAEARGLIPLHPNCRCSWSPKTKGGRRSRKEVKRKTVSKPTAKPISPQAPAEGLWGHQPTAVIRWMGKEGFSFQEAQAALQASGVDVAPGTIRAQLLAGRTGQRGAPAPLTLEQIEELKQRRKWVGPKPEPKPKPEPAPKPEPVTPPPVVQPQPAPIVSPTPPQPITSRPQFTEPPTAIVRWMGREGFSFQEAKRALNQAGLEVADATIRAQLQAGRTGKRGEPAKLNAIQAGFLKQVREGLGIVVEPPIAPKPITSGRPKHITFSGEVTEFAEKVWKETGRKIENPDHAKRIGKLVREEATKGIGPARDRLDALWAEYKSLGAQLHQEAITPDEYRQQGSPILQQIHQAKKEVEAVPFFETLKKVRDFGGVGVPVKSMSEGTQHGKTSKEYVQAGSKYLPKDWLEKIGEKLEFEVRFTQRGFWSGKEMGLSGTTEADYETTAVHELIHVAESALGLDFADLQRLFLEDRTGRPIKTVEPRPGEVAVKANFKHWYSGRVYANVTVEERAIRGGTNFEVLTTGVEDLHGATKGQPSKYGVADQSDTGFLDFVLGILAGF